MPATHSTGMTDEQVEELLEALLNFREVLLGLNDRFQNRMALLEQEFAERRSNPVELDAEKPLAALQRSATPELAEMEDFTGFETEAEENFDLLDEEEAFEPEEAEAFSILDIDDDDDDF